MVTPTPMTQQRIFEQLTSAVRMAMSLYTLLVCALQFSDTKRAWVCSAVAWMDGDDRTDLPEEHVLRSAASFSGTQMYDVVVVFSLFFFNFCPLVAESTFEHMFVLLRSMYNGSETDC